MLLLHVIPPALEEASTHGSASEEIIMELEAKVEARLYEIALMDLDDTRPVTVKIAVGKPTEEILRVAGEEAVDLIVMGTHGHSGLAHALILGGTAETVVRTAPCPVFTVRADPVDTP
jgi:nucleotide-binding universal stress UspA family protein